MTAVTAFSTSALHIITLLGLAFFLLALVIGSMALYQYFDGTAISGFTTVILLQLLIGGALMVSLGIVGEYLARIYDEVKARPLFIVRRRVPAGSEPGGHPSREDRTPE